MGEAQICFAGAGPGAADLLTLRAVHALQRCDLCLYAGSLVPAAVLSHLREDAIAIDSASMVLDEIVAIMIEAANAGQFVVRLHSGDPSIYGAIAEQINLLDAAGLRWEIIPGVPAFTAAAAALGHELTLPEISQSVVITRTSVRASGMPEHEELEAFARTRATLAIHLSINNLAHIIRVLVPHYGADCPCIVAARVEWPDQLWIRATLSTVRPKVKQARITRTALVLVGKVFANQSDASPSKLYDPAHSHVLRPAGTRGG
ncbi:MAG: precorrin-4 C(11)-methyltransferase, partial [Pseudomonadota bacterium]